jgi:hypothetical protein
MAASTYYAEYIGLDCEKWNAAFENGLLEYGLTGCLAARQKRKRPPFGGLSLPSLPPGQRE